MSVVRYRKIVILGYRAVGESSSLACEPTSGAGKKHVPAMGLRVRRRPRSRSREPLGARGRQLGNNVGNVQNERRQGLEWEARRRSGWKGGRTGKHALLG